MSRFMLSGEKKLNEKKVNDSWCRDLSCTGVFKTIKWIYIKT